MSYMSTVDRKLFHFFSLHYIDMTAAEIIAYMEREGWTFTEKQQFNQYIVRFERRDWHGVPCRPPFFVSRNGTSGSRYKMIREAGREALQLWRDFDHEPHRYHDENTSVIVWR